MQMKDLKLGDLFKDRDGHICMCIGPEEYLAEETQPDDSGNWHINFKLSRGTTVLFTDMDDITINPIGVNIVDIIKEYSNV